MKITRVDVIPLTGGTVDGGWPQGHQAEENLHTLLEIHTDAGVSGAGSCFTSGALVSGAMGLLWPLLEGESAVDMTVTLADGRTLKKQVRDCIGSRGRPMSDPEIEAKLTALAEGVLPRERVASIVEKTWGIDKLGDAATLIRIAA